MTVIQLRIYELTRAQLDALVAHAEGLDTRSGRDDWGTEVLTVDGGVGDRGCLPRVPYSPSTSWLDGGPIIEREKIAVYHDAEGAGWKTSRAWIAGYRLRIDEGFRGSELTGGDEPSIDLDNSACGPTPLVAAMRAYLRAKFGETVELPV